MRSYVGKHTTARPHKAQQNHRKQRERDENRFKWCEYCHKQVPENIRAVMGGRLGGLPECKIGRACYVDQRRTHAGQRNTDTSQGIERKQHPNDPA